MPLLIQLILTSNRAMIVFPGIALKVVSKFSINRTEKLNTQKIPGGDVVFFTGSVALTNSMMVHSHSLGSSLSLP